MKKIYSFLFLFFSLLSFAEKLDDYVFLNADKTIKVEFSLSPEKIPCYKVFLKRN